MFEVVCQVNVIIIILVFYKFSLIGIFGVVVIVELYLVIYIWLEYGYVVVDVFICGDVFDGVQVVCVFSECLGSCWYLILSMDCGFGGYCLGLFSCSLVGNGLVDEDSLILCWVLGQGMGVV